MGLIKTKHRSIALPKKVKLYRQTYGKSVGIKDVWVVNNPAFADDHGGWFKENMRLDAEGLHVGLKELGVNFRPVQTSTSRVAPKAKRFWHIHPEQNEIWTTSGTLVLGLIDLRRESSTYLSKMKVILPFDKYIYIPAGVAHGFINPNSDHVALDYITDRFFVANENTQEYRIDPELLSFDFVKSDLM